MHVHAQFGTFVVAWPRIKQCCLCNGKDWACALAQTNAHAHTDRNTWTHIFSCGFPGLERGWVGIWAMRPFWNLSIRGSPSLLIHMSRGAHSWPTCHTSVTLQNASVLLVSGHRADQIPTTAVHMLAHVHIVHYVRCTEFPQSSPPPLFLSKSCVTAFYFFLRDRIWSGGANYGIRVFSDTLKGIVIVCIVHFYLPAGCLSLSNI